MAKVMIRAETHFGISVPSHNPPHASVHSQVVYGSSDQPCLFDHHGEEVPRNDITGH